MTFIEHNNRLKANKFAEYITGIELRKYVAEKVKYYVGENISIFDGAVGSGQLEQFVNPKIVVGCDIQEESIQALNNNYEHVDAETISFFSYTQKQLCDCVIMNPPFSLKFKDLSQYEQERIQHEFSWKKSGVVDDIFVLKSLNYTKRYGFYILFPGVAYRSSEKKFREIIGNQLLEMNVIKNGFEDTKINVIFIVVDKEKTNNEVKRELYDCKSKKTLVKDNVTFDDYRWEIITYIEEKEKIDIDTLNVECTELSLKNIKKSIMWQVELKMLFDANINLDVYFGKLRTIINECEQEYKEKIKNGILYSEIK